jgi:hypothetical protein
MKKTTAKEAAKYLKVGDKVYIEAEFFNSDYSDMPLQVKLSGEGMHTCWFRQSVNVITDIEQQPAPLEVVTCAGKDSGLKVGDEIYVKAKCIEITKVGHLKMMIVGDWDDVRNFFYWHHENLSFIRAPKPAFEPKAGEVCIAVYGGDDIKVMPVETEVQGLIFVSAKSGVTFNRHEITEFKPIN